MTPTRVQIELDQHLHFGYNSTMGKNACWKNVGILEAERIENELGAKLGRPPRKKDFKDAGHYKVWMALYRYRKMMSSPTGNGRFQDLAEIYTTSIRKLVASCQDKRLLERIFTDFVHKLGPEKTAQIVQKVEKKFGIKLR